MQSWYGMFCMHQCKQSSRQKSVFGADIQKLNEKVDELKREHWKKLREEERNKKSDYLSIIKVITDISQIIMRLVFNS